MTLYDPLTYDNLMAALVVQFERQVKARLGEAAGIQGPGIYALFYTGALTAYKQIAEGNAPIYVGKAIPPGLRKGDTADVTAPVLQRRLNEHAKSIAQTDNLENTDFWCRYLAVQSGLHSQNDS